MSNVVNAKGSDVRVAILAKFGGHPEADIQPGSEADRFASILARGLIVAQPNAVLTDVAFHMRND